MDQTGNYSGTLTKAIMSYAQSGNPQIELRFDITHYSDGSDWGEVDTMQRTIYLSMHGGAKPITLEQMAKLGFASRPGVTQDPETKEALLDMPQGIADEQIQLECYTDTYNGQQKTRWRLKNTGAAPKPVEEEDIMKFKTMFE